MATEATFDNQLQALATATANFANGKDADIKNTIITALGGNTQSGGGGKQEGIITLTTNDGGATYTVDYNGDGTLFVVAGEDVNNNPPATLSGNTLTVKRIGPIYTAGYGYVVAMATDNFTAAIAEFEEYLD